MAELDKKTIKNLTALSRIDCTEEEEAFLLNDLKSILDYVNLLDEIDTRDIPPCNHVLDDIRNVEREDIPGQTMPRKDFLDNAPSHVGGLVKVPPVLKQN